MLVVKLDCHMLTGMLTVAFPACLSSLSLPLRGLGEPARGWKTAHTHHFTSILHPHFIYRNEFRATQMAEKRKPREPVSPTHRRI